MLLSLIRALILNASLFYYQELNPALLGLSLASLRRGVGLSDDQQLRAHEEMAQLVLLPRVEQKLRVKCTELCDIMFPGLAHMSSSHHKTIETSKTIPSSSISRVAELPALLLETQARKTQLEQESKQLKQQLHAQLLQDVERCKEMTALVAQLLMQHKRDDQARVLHAKIQWLAAFSKAMRLKAQVLTNQLVVETYTPEKVDVLRAAQYVNDVALTSVWGIPSFGANPESLSICHNIKQRRAADTQVKGVGGARYVTLVAVLVAPGKASAVPECRFPVPHDRTRVRVCAAKHRRKEKLAQLARPLAQATQERI